MDPQQTRWAAPRVTLSSGTPGRTRLKTARLVRSAQLAGVVRRGVLEIPEVTAVDINLVTGSVLIRHAPTGKAAELLTALTVLLDERCPLPSADSAEVVPLQPNNNSRSTVPPSDDAIDYWHAMSRRDVLAELDVEPNEGLSDAEVGYRRRVWGSNRLTTIKPRGELDIFLEQFLNLPVAMLGGSATLSMATRSFADAAVTAGVVFTNAVIGWATESSAQRLIGKVTSADVVDASVIRDGREQRIPASRIVPGDMLILRRGDSVPADARLLDSHTLSVNESLLTGESVPVMKASDGQLARTTVLAERTNQVFMGTTISGGSARAVVVNTGPNTIIGRIQALSGEARAPKPPIERDLDRLGRDLGIGALVICGLAFGLGVIRGHGTLAILKSAIALAVAAVPEGLPAIATSTLALGLRRMRTEQLLVRRLQAVEGLGSVEVLCLDKTGTLTENRMQVTAVVIDGEQWDIDPQVTMPAPVETLAHMAFLAAETEVSESSPAALTSVSGTERALIEFMMSTGTTPEDLQQHYQRVHTRLRDDAHNYVAVSYQHRGQQQLAVKGRPNEVLDLCRNIHRNGASQPLSETERQDILLQNDRLAAAGLRVLAVAYDSNQHSLLDTPHLTWCGLVGMHDPIRNNAREVISRFQRAGIRTVMITGDQAPTAIKTAKALNLSAGEPLQILDASELESLDSLMLRTLADRCHVFARVSPAKKLEIVQALQAAGHVVGMTGDGINDGPALKAADVGIAMGRDGARIARDVADVVIQDDNLEHLLHGIAEGRTILANILKSVHFLLATNLSEIFVIFAEITRGPRELESSMELFWINLVTDVFPSIGLALEPPMDDVLFHKPRRRDEPLIDKAYYKQLAKEASIIGGTALAAHFCGMMRHGAGPQTRALTFYTLISAQLLHTLTCRRDRFQKTPASGITNNPGLIGALTASAGLQLLPLLVPPVRRMLGIGTIDLLDLAVMLAASLTSYAANERVSRPPPNPKPLEHREPAIAIAEEVMRQHA